MFCANQQVCAGMLRKSINKHEDEFLPTFKMYNIFRTQARVMATREPTEDKRLRDREKEEAIWDRSQHLQRPFLSECSSQQPPKDMTDWFTLEGIVGMDIRTGIYKERRGDPK